MPRYEEWKNGTAAERIKISRENVRDNPHIAAYQFHRRFIVFMEKVISPKFNARITGIGTSGRGVALLTIMASFGLKEGCQRKIQYGG